MLITRTWAMPSRHTFTIKPIREQLDRLVGDGLGWADPFAGHNSPAEHTNDLNPDTPARSHLPAIDFLQGLPVDSLEGILFDPPYSVRQVSECYKGFGREVTAEDTRATFWSDAKDAAKDKVRLGGLAICYGWNSGGFGKSRGYDLEEVLLVPHGGPHHDTIVTVERRLV